MNSFDRTLRNMFSSGNSITQCLYCYGVTSNHLQDLERENLYMEVPMKDKRIEIPTFLIDTFRAYIKQDNQSDNIVAILNSSGNTPRYVSFNKIMEVVLEEPFSKSRLIRVEGKDGDRKKIYYATCGAIFNENFKPLVMASWILENKPYEIKMINYVKTELRWYFIKPILRINPNFYLDKPDNVGRYILKKVIPALFSYENQIYVPIDYYDNAFGNNSSERMTPSIVIEQCPFTVRGVNKPSISTSNEILSKTVIDNMEDFT